MREEVEHWAQDEAADVLGVSRSTIAGYESEQTGRTPHREKSRNITELFGAGIDYPITGEDRSSNTSEDPSIPPEERAFLDWVKNNLEGNFIYDFDKSPEEQKKQMMEEPHVIWTLEKNRRPGQKQGE